MARPEEVTATERLVWVVSCPQVNWDSGSQNKTPVRTQGWYCFRTEKQASTPRLTSVIVVIFLISCGGVHCREQRRNSIVGPFRKSSSKAITGEPLWAAPRGTCLPMEARVDRCARVRG